MVRSSEIVMRLDPIPTNTTVPFSFLMVVAACVAPMGTANDPFKSRKSFSNESVDVAMSVLGRPLGVSDMMAPGRNIDYIAAEFDADSGHWSESGHHESLSLGTVTKTSISLPGKTKKTTVCG